MDRRLLQTVTLTLAGLCIFLAGHGPDTHAGEASAPPHKKQKPRLALVSTEHDPAVKNVLTLAEVQLSRGSVVDLVDRQGIDKILLEQKLGLLGLLKEEHVLKVGRLLGVNLFAVVEIDVAKKQAVGMVVFDAGTGIRLWDASLPGDTLEKAVEGVTQAVHAAVEKYHNRKDLKTVCLTTVRNVDMPRAKDSFCDTIGFLVERGLVILPSLALLERTRLEEVIKERNLQTDSPWHELLASLVRVQLEIERSPDGKGIRARALLFDHANKRLGSPHIDLATENAADIADALLVQVRKSLQAAPLSGVRDRLEEAKGFGREADFWDAHNAKERAWRMREAAVALDPADLTQRGKLVSAFFVKASDMLRANLKKPQPSLKEDVERSLEIVLRAVGEQENIEAEWRMKAKASDWPIDSMSFKVYKTVLARLVPSQTPETPKSRELLARIDDGQSRLVDARFNQALASISDKESFSRVLLELTTLYSPIGVERDHGLSPADHQRLWRQNLERWSQLALRHASPPLSPDTVTRIYRVIRQVLLAGGSSAALEQYRSVLRQAKDPFITLHDVMVDKQLRLFRQPLPRPDLARHFREFRLLLQELLLSEEAGRSVFLRWACYDSFFVLFYQATGQTPNQCYVKDYRDPLDQECVEFCRFMMAGKDLHQELAMALFPPTGPPKANAAQALQFSNQLLSMLDSPITNVKYRPGLRLALTQSRLRILRAYPELAGPRVNPWTDIQKLVDVAGAGSGIVRLAKPLVSGDAVYVVFFGQEGTTPDGRYLQLCRFHLPTGAKRLLGRIAVDTDYRPAEASGFAWMQSLFHPYLGAPLCCFVVDATIADGRYFLGTQQGIFIFSLDNNDVERLHTGNSLPANQVQRLAVVDGKLIAALGLPPHECYLIARDVAKQRTAILASSRRADVQSPFDNIPWQVRDLVADPAHQRILAYFEVHSKPDVMGLWELDAKTYRFRHVHQVPRPDSGFDWMSPPYKDEILIAMLPVTIRVDLPSGKATSKRFVRQGHAPFLESRLADLRDLAAPGKLPPQLCEGHFIADGWLWCGSDFTRVSLDGQRKEFLASPRQQSDAAFYPHEGFQLIANQMLLADSYGLWVATLPRRLK